MTISWCRNEYCISILSVLPIKNIGILSVLSIRDNGVDILSVLPVKNIGIGH